MAAASMAVVAAVAVVAVAMAAVTMTIPVPVGLARLMVAPGKQKLVINKYFLHYKSSQVVCMG